MTTTLWGGLGNAGTIAQLVGVDAAGLISMIIQAVQTVERNKKRCWQLVHQVLIIGELLPLLQQSSDMMARPLEGLEDTLRQTYMLVTSCQQGNIVYRLLMAGSQAQKFRDIRNRIDLYLKIYPLISHIDTRHLLSGGQDSRRARHASAPQSQASEEIPESSASLSNPDCRTQGSDSNDNGASVEIQAVTEPIAVEEQKRDGYENAEPMPNRKHWFSWLLQWAQREPSIPPSVHDLIGLDQQSGSFTFFKFSQLAASTNRFSPHNRIGKGAYGNVYKGVLPNGLDIAIKTCHVLHHNSLQEFNNELQIIPKLQHANIIKLLGCCIEGKARILVYEYMPRSLYHNIIQELKRGVSLAWHLRFRIIEGFTQGVVYLHQNSRLRLVHRDLKHILLDCDLDPRISGFGLAKVLKSNEDEVEVDVAGTCTISTKSDVYTFGVTVLEIITARSARELIGNDVDDSTFVISLPSYAFELWSSGRAMELVDASLRNEPQISEILRCMQIAMLCVQFDPADRPTMSDVLMMLKCESMALPVPRAPPSDTSRQEAGDSTPDGSEAEGSTSYRSA